MKGVANTGGGPLLIILIAVISITASTKSEYSVHGTISALAVGLIIMTLAYLFAFQPDWFVDWKLVPKDGVGNISILGHVIGIGFGLCLIAAILYLAMIR